MSTASKIEWTDATWNPVVGCSIVSPGCTNCYAMRDAWRKHDNPAIPHYRDLTKTVKGNAVWTGKVALAPDHILTAPLRWRKPRRVFVNSMGDMFHENVPDEWIDRVFAVMALCPQHQFQVLTKRAERMREYVEPAFHRIVEMMFYLVNECGVPTRRDTCERHGIPYTQPRSAHDWYPLHNVWFGVSAERQQEADERIPHLLQTPAAIRFVSCEPLLGPIDLRSIQIKLTGRGADALASYPMLLDGLTGFCRELWNQNVNDPAHGGDFCALDWIIVGAESGPCARPMHPDWARSLRDQCASAGVPFFFKQWGEWATIEVKGNDPNGDYDTRLIAPDGKHIDHSEADYCDFPDTSRFVYRVGKKAAGRLLDGREHNEWPLPRARRAA